MGSELTRIGVSLPGKLLTKFDKTIEKNGFSSRSEGIRDSIRNYIKYYEWMGEVKGKRVATISLIYDPKKIGISNAFADIQQENIAIIKSSIRTLVDPHNCFEVFVLEGEGTNIRTFAERIMALKGIKYVKLSTVIPE